MQLRKFTLDEEISKITDESAWVIVFVLDNECREWKMGDSCAPFYEQCIR